MIVVLSHDISGEFVKQQELINTWTCASHWSFINYSRLERKKEKKNRIKKTKRMGCYYTKKNILKDQERNMRMNIFNVTIF